jgi:hypothetical protein
MYISRFLLGASLKGAIVIPGVVFKHSTASEVSAATTECRSEVKVSCTLRIIATVRLADAPPRLRFELIELRSRSGVLPNR